MIEIERLRPEHLDRLKVFFEAINNPAYVENFSPHPFDDENANRVCNYNGQDLYYSVLLDRSEIIAYGILRGWDEGFEIPSIGLCVLQGYQGRGLGELLMNLLETVSRLRSCQKVMLKVKKNNTAAISLYEKRKYVFSEYNKDFLVGYKNLIK